ncbi:hypothetical protein F383_33512 [Gossypium arboreum]|uniref:Uncharacterized protein n=1 Tax=Gossypium arboreum TaxID=29729 RepID=A0A0B0MWQ4_GOSAR|nr:hypothetical protein F383_33512 [Gossypium arboreum]
MPLSQTRSYSHTYIGVTYQCQCINVVLPTHIYQNPMS